VTDSDSRLESDTDISSVLNRIQYKKGPERLCMGVCDYSPSEQTPHKKAPSENEEEMVLNVSSTHIGHFATKTEGRIVKIVENELKE
jgi:hypothetical protein